MSDERERAEPLDEQSAIFLALVWFLARETAYKAPALAVAAPMGEMRLSVKEVQAFRPFSLRVATEGDRLTLTWYRPGAQAREAEKVNDPDLDGPRG